MPDLVTQEHGTVGDGPRSGIHDRGCKWLCKVPIGTPCTRTHTCSKCQAARPRPTSYMVIDSERDNKGCASFTTYWSDPDGVFRHELSKYDGKPVGFRRGQCFRAIPEDHLKRGVVLVESEATAIAKAWGSDVV